MLELKSISFTVSSAAEQAEKGILDDVSLTVGDNQFVVITGPNGGGKSTLAKIIMGIERPTAGRILFDGQDITDCRSPSAPSWASPTPFSSRCASRA